MEDERLLLDYDINDHSVSEESVVKEPMDKDNTNRLKQELNEECINQVGNGSAFPTGRQFELSMDLKIRKPNLNLNLNLCGTTGERNVSLIPTLQSEVGSRKVLNTCGTLPSVKALNLDFTFNTIKDVKKVTWKNEAPWYREISDGFCWMCYC
jgi:hypothetical protein